MDKNRYFLASDGTLYREPGFHLLRERYSYHHRDIANTLQLRATLRAGSYAWPGGYPLYFITSDGGALSFKTVRENYRQISYAVRHALNDGWRVVGCDINHEDNDLIDDHTGEKIESAYGNEESEDE